MTVVLAELRCAKCLGGDVAMTYHRQGCDRERCSCVTCSSHANARRHDEHLHFDCRTCQFDWVGDVADTPAHPGRSLAGGATGGSDAA